MYDEGCGHRHRRPSSPLSDNKAANEELKLSFLCSQFHGRPELNLHTFSAEGDGNLADLQEVVRSARAFYILWSYPLPEWRKRGMFSFFIVIGLQRVWGYSRPILCNPLRWRWVPVKFRRLIINFMAQLRRRFVLYCRGFSNPSPRSRGTSSAWMHLLLQPKGMDEFLICAAFTTLCNHLVLCSLEKHTRYSWYSNKVWLDENLLLGIEMYKVTQGNIPINGVKAVCFTVLKK